MNRLDELYLIAEMLVQYT